MKHWNWGRSEGKKDVKSCASRRKALHKSNWPTEAEKESRVERAYRQCTTDYNEQFPKRVRGIQILMLIFISVMGKPCPAPGAGVPAGRTCYLPCQHRSQPCLCLSSTAPRGHFYKTHSLLLRVISSAKISPQCLKQRTQKDERIQGNPSYLFQEVNQECDRRSRSEADVLVLYRVQTMPDTSLS